MNSAPPNDQFGSAIDDISLHGSRVPELPADIDAESSLLGSVMVDNGLLATLDLDSQHFFEPLHQSIYETSKMLFKEGKRVTPITLGAYFGEQKINEELSVRQYIARICASAALPVVAESISDLLRDLHDRRQAITIMKEGIESLCNIDPALSGYDIVRKSRSKMGEILDAGDSGSGADSVEDIFDNEVVSIGRAMAGEGQTIYPGFEPISVLTGRWSPGNLIVIAGGTKQGKSALAMQCAFGAAIDVPVFVWSGEMGKAELIRREISRVTKISTTRQKRGDLSNREAEMVIAARSEISRRNMFISEKQMTVDQLSDVIERFAAKFGTGMVFVDYIALLSRDKNTYRMEKFAFCEYVTDSLKRIARRTGTAIVALSQLKKNVFDQDRGKSFSAKLSQIRALQPRYTDVYGGIERDVDHLIMPFRAHPLLAAIEPAQDTPDHLEWEDVMREEANRAKLILALSREQHFPKRVDVGWHGETTTFTDLGVDTFGRSMF